MSAVTVEYRNFPLELKPTFIRLREMFEAAKKKKFKVGHESATVNYTLQIVSQLFSDLKVIVIVFKRRVSALENDG